MESLFARSAPKRGHVCLTLGASLLLHGGLVGVAEMWTPPQPREHSVEMNWDDYPELGNAPIISTLVQVDNPDNSTPPPPAADLSVAVPVEPQVDPEFAEPTQTPVTHRAMISKPAATVIARNNHSPAMSGSVSSAVANSTNSGAGGVKGSMPAATASAWFMPHPPYPQSMMGRSSNGATTVHITTDAGGQISSVVVTQSAGNALLDSYTESYVRAHWHGPANASRNTQFVYQTR